LARSLYRKRCANRAMPPQNNRKSLRTKEKVFSGQFDEGVVHVLIDGCQPTLHGAAVGLHATHTRCCHCSSVGWAGGLLMGTRGPCGCSLPHDPCSGGKKSGNAGIVHGGMLTMGPLPLPPSGSTGSVVVPPRTADAASRSSNSVRDKSLIESEVMTVLLEE
jgi:hypothetical protein